MHELVVDHDTLTMTIWSTYLKSTFFPSIWHSLGSSDAKITISPAPLTLTWTIHTPSTSDTNVIDLIAPPELSMLTSPMGANCIDFWAKIVIGETVTSSKSNGSNESSMFALGFTRMSFFWWNRYNAKVSTLSTDICGFPFCHSTSLGLIVEVRMREYSEAHWLRLVSRHHPPPWQLNAPITPVYW